MIKAYWHRIALFALAGAIVFFGASMMMPNKYEAVVELKTDQALPTQTVSDNDQGQNVNELLNATRMRNIQTQVDELGSLGVLTRAAEQVANEHDPNMFTDPKSELNPENLRQEVSIESGNQSDIIVLSVRMRDAKLAVDTTQHIYEAFLDENEKTSKELARRAIASLKTQAASIDQQLKQIDQKARDVKARTGFPDVANQVTAEISGLNQAKEARDAAMIEAAGDHQTVNVLTSELASMPKMIPQSSTTTTNPIWEKLQGDLAGAQADRAQLLGTFLPNSDQVKAADERIQNIEKQLKDLKTDVKAQTNEGLNQNYLTVQAQLATAKAAANAADSKVKVASAEVAEREKYLAGLPDVQTELAGLTREQLALEKIYFGYQDRLKTLEAAKEGTITPIEEIGQPTVDSQPVSPKPKVNAIIGLLVGVVLGVLSMLLTEAKSQPIRSLAQLNGLSLQPVYRLIPELRQPYRGLDKAPPETYEGLLLNYLQSKKHPYRIGVVGVNRDSGASTTALNLAIAGSRHGKGVLLVQCDPKGVFSRLGMKEPPAGQALEVASLVKATATTSALSVSQNHPGISESVAPLEGELTIFDFEPATRSAEYAFLAPYVDEMIVLVRAGRARSVEFLQVQQALKDAGCKRVTVVFTRSSDLAVVDAVDVVMEGSAPGVVELPTTQPGEPTRRIEFKEPEPELTFEAPEAKEAAEPEAPVSRRRTTPSVGIEDFGGIARAKEPKKPAAKPRRGNIDTSDIES